MPALVRPKRNHPHGQDKTKNNDSYHLKVKFYQNRKCISPWKMGSIEIRSLKQTNSTDSLYLNMELLKKITIPSLFFIYLIYMMKIRRRTPEKTNNDKATYSVTSSVVFALLYIIIWGYCRYYIYVYLAIEEKYSYIFNVLFFLMLIAVWEFSRFVEIRLRNKIKTRYNKRLQKTP